MRRRSLLAGALALPAMARAAEATEVRFARQFSLGYLQFNVMERYGLLEKHAAALGLPRVKASWATFNGPDQMNSALISDSVDIVSGGVPGLLTLWAKTQGSSMVAKGVCGLSAQPILLNSRVPEVRSIADLSDRDKIAVPAVKVSVQALVLQMAAAKQWGDAQFARLDPLTVSLSPPDATAAILTGSAGITAVFGVPPYQTQQLERPGIHTILDSFDAIGPHSFSVAWTTGRFHDRNPTLYRALIAALREATELVNADRHAAAQLWVEDTRSKLPVDEVARVVSGPEVHWTMAPQGVATFAGFMQRVGTIKTAPANWTDAFFPELGAVDGS